MESSRVSTAITSIASLSQQQRVATEEVAASAEEMSAQVEEISAQAEQLAATAQELRRLAARFTMHRGTSDKPEDTFALPRAA